jgi:hypothetical protein
VNTETQSSETGPGKLGKDFTARVARVVHRSLAFVEGLIPIRKFELDNLRVELDKNVRGFIYGLTCEECARAMSIAIYDTAGSLITDGNVKKREQELCGCRR